MTLHRSQKVYHVVSKSRCLILKQLVVFNTQNTFDKFASCSAEAIRTRHTNTTALCCCVRWCTKQNQKKVDISFAIYSIYLSRSSDSFDRQLRTCQELMGCGSSTVEPESTACFQHGLRRKMPGNARCIDDEQWKRHVKSRMVAEPVELEHSSPT